MRIEKDRGHEPVALSLDRPAAPLRVVPLAPAEPDPLFTKTKV